MEKEITISMADWIQIGLLILGIASVVIPQWRNRKKTMISDALRWQELKNKLDNWIEDKEKVDTEQTQKSAKIELEFSEFKKLFYENSKTFEKRLAEVEHSIKTTAKEFEQISAKLSEIKIYFTEVIADIKKMIEKENINTIRIIEEKIKNLDEKIKPTTTRARKS